MNASECTHLDVAASKKQVHFYNVFHIGDCIMILRFLYNNHVLLQTKQIVAIFYYNPSYIKQFVIELERYCVPGVIELKNESLKPPDSFDTWMGNEIVGITKYHSTSRFAYQAYYEALYKNMVIYMNLVDNDIYCGLWQHEDYLLHIRKGLPDVCTMKDILIINGIAKSGQYNRPVKEMDDLCIFLNRSFPIITTRKVLDIPCTLDFNLRLQDIGAISTGCRVVIAIMTGPLCAVYNETTHKNVKKWFLIVSNGKTHAHNDTNIELIINGSLSPIYNYFTH